MKHNSNGTPKLDVAIEQLRQSCLNGNPDTELQRTISTIMKYNHKTNQS